jgi:aspartate racemase
MEMIEDTLTKQGCFRDCQHLEMIVYYATGSPSRSMYLEGKGESFVESYIDVANKLKAAGAEKIAMCCNTAHYSIDEISEKSGAPFIDLIEKVVKVCKNKANSKKCKIGLIASDGCLKGRVYEKCFDRIFPEAELVIPSAEMQKEVTRGICNVKNACRFLPEWHKDRPQNIFQNICDSLITRGAEMIVLGCTDIRVDFTYRRDNICIDSLEVLADAILEERGMCNRDSITFWEGYLSDPDLKLEGTKLGNLDSSAIDSDFILKHAVKDCDILDIGSGGGMIINRLHSKVGNIVCVELFEQFSRFIVKSSNVSIVNKDIFDYKPNRNEKFDLITSFGTLHYFNESEAQEIYKKYAEYLKSGGKMIVKQQFGITETVTVQNFSTELGRPYFAQYRTIEEEKRMLGSTGLEVIEIADIYPPEYNKWSNTHYFAIVARKG